MIFITAFSAKHYLKKLINNKKFKTFDNPFAEEENVRQILYPVIILFLGSSCLFAQNKLDKKGKTGFSFFFKEFDVKSFDEKLCAKYWLSNNISIRTEIGFDKHTGDSDYDPSKSNTNLNQNSIEFSCGVAKYFKTNQQITPYSGILLSLIIENFENKISESYSYREEKQDNLIYKLSLPVGVEYWLTKSITLSAENSFCFSYGKLKTRHVLNDVSSEVSESSLDIKIDDFFLVLSVYF